LELSTHRNLLLFAECQFHHIQYHHSTDNPRSATTVPPTCTNMPGEQQQQKQKKRATRQQPVSCRSCRSRKLRCDRGFPCSNCASRGVACESENAVPAHALTLNSELLERVRNLERLAAENHLVHRSENVTPLLPSQVAAPSQGTPSQGTPTQGTSLGSTISSQATPAKAVTPPEIESFNSDIAHLESIYSDGERLGSILTCSLISHN
jgi:hypothetical protein